MEFIGVTRNREPKENRNEKREHAVKDICDLVELTVPQTLIIEAIYKDYGYSLPAIYLLLKEARLRLATLEKNKEVGLKV